MRTIAQRPPCWFYIGRRDAVASELFSHVSFFFLVAGSLYCCMIGELDVKSSIFYK